MVGDRKKSQEREERRSENKIASEFMYIFQILSPICQSRKVLLMNTTSNLLTCESFPFF